MSELNTRLQKAINERPTFYGQLLKECRDEIERLTKIVEHMETCKDYPARLEMLRELERLKNKNAKLREACEIFKRYGLPPHDVSGSSEWKRAEELSESEDSDDS